VTRQALVVWGGWDGHSPEEMARRATTWLEQDGFAVETTTDLDVYAGLSERDDVDLIVQAVTMAELGPAAEAGLLDAVRRGVGLAGWHGGLCDSFRASCSYQFLTGGQWVAHPGGSSLDYTIDLLGDDPITAGLQGFNLTGEQYYLHVDPAVEVLATTTFLGTEAEPWTKGVVMPVMWKKSWGAGRVFYASFGHHPAELDVPEVETLLRRGMQWASRQ
jgi:type 1 glutamine amidotransferase